MAQQSHAAGWTSGSPTPAQLKEFFAQVESGRITKEGFQSFLRGDGVVKTVLTTQDEERAIAILGKARVVTLGEVTQKWRRALSEIPSVPFSEEVLGQCAKENEAGDADWRLVYVLGLSLREQRELRGTDNCKPCFNTDTWWLEKSEDSWATKGVEPGYRLLNFKLQFRSMNWKEQRKAIAKFCRNDKRAEEQAVSEAILSVFMVTGECLLKLSYHWGISQDFADFRVLVGRFVSFDLVVSHCWPNNSSFDIGVVLARKS